MKNFYDWIKEFVRDQGEFIAQQSGWLELERSSYAKLIAQTISHVLNGGSLLVSADSSRHWFLSYILSNLNPKDLKKRPYCQSLILTLLLSTPKTMRISL